MAEPERLAWGVAATGRIALEVGAVIRDHPDMHVAAVGSRDLARAQVAARELGAPAAHGSYAELVEDPAVQAVYVATPHTGHAEVVEAALAAGKPVLCEKPLTASLAETERLVALAQRSGTFLMEAMWMRFNPLVQRLAAVAASGELGELRSLRAAFGFSADPDPAGRLWDPALGGGALLDLGIYPVSLARLLLGTPTELTVAGSLGPTGVDAESTLALGFEGGARALLDCSLLADLPGTALLVGSAGWAELSRPFHAPTRLVLQTGDEPVEHLLDGSRAGFVGELEEVARCRAEGRTQSDVVSLEETVATMRVLEQARTALGAG